MGGCGEFGFNTKKRASYAVQLALLSYKNNIREYIHDRADASLYQEIEVSTHLPSPVNILHSL